MIERIRLNDDTERYAVEIGAGEVIVIMALADGSIKIMGEGDSVKAVLNEYETWTASNSSNAFNPLEYNIQAVQSTGADFLIVRYYR